MQRVFDLSTYRANAQVVPRRFKISNSFVRFYADRFGRLHPELDGFFRKSKRTTSIGREDELRQQVTEFHRRNPSVWIAFERFALDASSRFKSYSADAVMHRVRWSTDLGESLDGD